MPVIDGLTKHLIEGHAKACADALRARGRSVMVVVVVAEHNAGGGSAGLMASSWDQLSPGVAQGFGQVLGRAALTLEEAAHTKNPDVLKGGTGSLI
jgi:hypothetical protein